MPNTDPTESTPVFAVDIEETRVVTIKRTHIVIALTEGEAFQQARARQARLWEQFRVTTPGTTLGPILF